MTSERREITICIFSNRGDRDLRIVSDVDKTPCQWGCSVLNTKWNWVHSTYYTEYMYQNSNATTNHYHRRFYLVVPSRWTQYTTAQAEQLESPLYLHQQTCNLWSVLQNSCPPLMIFTHTLGQSCGQFWHRHWTDNTHTNKHTIPNTVALSATLVASWQLLVGSWELGVGSWQLVVGSWELGVARELAVGSWQYGSNPNPQGHRNVMLIPRLRMRTEAHQWHPNHPNSCSNDSYDIFLFLWRNTT